MRSASFDVPAAMEHVYEQLRSLGFRSRISLAQAEWDDIVTGEYVRFAHVAGWCEAWYRPLGKRQDGGRHFRKNKAGIGVEEFKTWLDDIIATIQGDRCALTSSSSTSSP